MPDASAPSEPDEPDARAAGEGPDSRGDDPDPRGAGSNPEDDLAALDEEELRAAVEEKYDFENFDERQMAEITPDEWDAAFDPDSWITGDRLLDRLERELNRRVAQREVFAVVEPVTIDGERCLIAYSDQDYALVHADGSVEGFGTVLRDVRPSVALCSMERYEVEDPPDGEFLLPHPEEIPEESSQLGNNMIQVIAGAQVLAALVLFGGSFLVGARSGVGDGTAIIMAVAGVGFLFIGVVLFFTVANARLSDRFRSEEYRNRLRAVGLEDGERPEFLPVEVRATDVEEETADDERTG